jgi:hypothetical protein
MDASLLVLVAAALGSTGVVAVLGPIELMALCCSTDRIERRSGMSHKPVRSGDQEEFWAVLDSLLMSTLYNRIAGQSVERLAALSDGIFAVAMTLLVLDLHVPAREAIHDSRELGRAMVSLAPQLTAYMMSFITLGIFWIGQQTQLNHLSPLRSQSFLDPHHVPVRGVHYAVLHPVARRIHCLPDGASRVLVQHSAPGIGVVLQLGLRDGIGPGQR